MIDPEANLKAAEAVAHWRQVTDLKGWTDVHR